MPRPLRIEGLGLGKSDQRRARVLGCENPKRELVRGRLETLRNYPWSSWRVYIGMESNPGWLETGLIGRACGGRSRSEQRAALKAYTEEPIRQGVLESPWEGLIGGAVLGDTEYARKLLLGRNASDQEQRSPGRVLDPLGIPVNAGVGKHKIKVDMTQQYKCRSSDGTEVTDSKHIKISDSEKWKGPPQPPKKK